MVEVGIHEGGGGRGWVQDYAMAPALSSYNTQMGDLWYVEKILSEGTSKSTYLVGTL